VALQIENASDLGWEVKEQEDDLVITRRWLHSWCRVEQVMTQFRIKAEALERSGWTSAES
jgi:hypothetical protein